MREALAPAVRALEDLLGAARPVVVSAAGLDRWHEVFRTLQGAEAWAAHGAWLEQAKPRIGPFLVERLRLAATLGAAEIAAAQAERAAIRARLDDLLADDALLLLPSAPCAAPLIDAPLAEHERIRAQLIGITSIASLGGLPQVSLPLARVAEGPVGLSLLAGRGRDTLLLDLVAGPLAALAASGRRLSRGRLRHIEAPARRSCQAGRSRRSVLPRPRAGRRRPAALLNHPARDRWHKARQARQALAPRSPRTTTCGPTAS